MIEHFFKMNKITTMQNKDGNYHRIPNKEQRICSSSLTNRKPIGQLKRIALTLVFICLITFINAQQLNLLPAIPELATNPYLKTAFEGVKVGNKIALDDLRDHKEIGVQDRGKELGEIPVATLAYLHPNSPHKGQQAILDRLIVLLDGRFKLWSEDKNLGDHMFSFEPTYAYLALKTYAPDKIPADKKAMWEAAIAKHTNFLINDNPKIYKEHLAGALIVNMDIFRIQSVYYGALATGDTASAAIGKAAMEECMTKTVLGDGATYYVSYSNEVFLYHNSIVKGATWYYLLTGSQKMKDFIYKMIPYIPLTQHNGGFGEYSTAPPWKPFYGPLSPQAALVMAYITGDPYNYALGKDASKDEILFPFIYHSGLVAKKAPDNIMVYDKNILGPRVRNGAWGMVGTTRDPSHPGPEMNETPTPGMVGISTFAGAYILKSPNGALNAAFHGTAPEVKIKQGVETDLSRGNNWAFLTGVDGHSAVSKSNTVFGLSTRYNINNRGGGLTTKSYTGWDGIQEWVYTPDRMIGLCEISTDKEQKAFGLAERIVLFSHRGACKPRDGKAQELKGHDKGEWSYGNLKVKTHDKSFNGKEETFYYGVMANYDGKTSNGDEGSVMIKLHDEKSGDDRATTYPAGTKRFALLEVTHEGIQYSTNVTKLKLPEGLTGFEFTEQIGRKIRMVHNYTDKGIDYSGTMAASFTKARVLKSWDDTDVNALSIKKGSVTVPSIHIPAYSNIIILNSNNSDDFVAGYMDYQKVFK